MTTKTSRRSQPSSYQSASKTTSCKTRGYLTYREAVDSTINLRTERPRARTDEETNEYLAIAGIGDRPVISVTTIGQCDRESQSTRQHRNLGAVDIASATG